jgi:transposase, IS30 family
VVGNPKRILSEETRREIIRCSARGMLFREVMAAVGESERQVRAVLRPLGGVLRTDWNPTGHRLSMEERVEIRRGLDRELAFNAIGRGLGRAGSTIAHEVNVNGGRDAYVPTAAHASARQRARRPKQAKLVMHPELGRRVCADLEALWSPEQITRRLHLEFPDQPEMWVSHETIYQLIYVQGRGALRRELAACLRTGRARRRSQHRMDRRGSLPAMVSISGRPAEVEDRAVPGHWEGDLIMGSTASNSAIGTLVERSTRFVMLLHLPDGHTAEAVREAMTATIQTLPAALFRTLTWDQGKEMAEHVRFSVDTGVDVYFCDPHAPWQRGSNENTNGLLRQYLPKGTDLSVHGPDELRRIADSLNNRPRKTLGWLKPCERLAQVIASTV